MTATIVRFCSSADVRHRLRLNAAQGIEAQTMANVYLALEQNLTIVAVINKIDLPSADPDRVSHEVQNFIGLLDQEIVRASAKSGIGIDDILEAIVTQMPPPEGDPTAPTRALIFDSHYDAYKGVIAYVKVVDGRLKPGEPLRLITTGGEADSLEVGYFSPGMTPAKELNVGEVGYVATGLKAVKDLTVGDTLTVASRPAKVALPGYHPSQPMVFAGLYPVESSDYPMLRDALDKLQLNDASLTYEPESSAALGFGFRCGFLGLLHMEIVQERLEREFDIDLLATAPSVEYHVRAARRNTGQDRQSLRASVTGRNRGHSRTVGQDQRHHSDTLYRRDHGPGDRPARHLSRNGLPGR